MPRARLALLLLLLLLAGCTPLDGVSTQAGEPVVLRAGTSFGECLGYCATELRIDAEEIVFVRTSWRPTEYPAQTARMDIDPAEWETLQSLASRAAFAGLESVYGCPDCADGGAEWIEIERNGRRQRVTFEHGSVVPPIEPLIVKVREIRGRFEQ